MSKAKKKRIAHQKRMKAQERQKTEARVNGWEGCDWRVEGTPGEYRYESPQQADRARRRVARMKPNGPKGKKQTGGRRPNNITVSRIHHSRGKKWDEFVIAMGIEDLSEYEQRIYFDNFSNGGQEVFAQWKQQQYESKVVVEKVRYLDYGNGKKMQVIRDPETGELKQIPYVPSKEEREAENKKKVKVSRKRGSKHCSECGMSIPTSLGSREKCTTCAPAKSAQDFFQAVLKQQQAELARKQEA